LHLLAIVDHLRVEIRPLALEDIPVVETGGPVRLALSEMPLADDRGLVAVALEDLGDVFLGVVEVGADGGDFIYMVVGAGEYGRAAGFAQRVGAEAIIEAHAAVGDAVEVRGFIDLRAIATHRVCGVVVGHDEEYVGTGHR